MVAIVPCNNGVFLCPSFLTGKCVVEAGSGQVTIGHGQVDAPVNADMSAVWVDGFVLVDWLRCIGLVFVWSIGTCIAIASRMRMMAGRPARLARHGQRMCYRQYM